MFAVGGVVSKHGIDWAKMWDERKLEKRKSRRRRKSQS